MKVECDASQKAWEPSAIAKILAARRAAKRCSSNFVAESVTMANMLTSKSVVVATKQQVSCELGAEAAILNTKNSVYYGLNPVGASVWRLLQEPRSMREIRDAIAGEYEVGLERLEKDLMGLVNEMAEQGLVEIRDGRQ